MNIWLDLDETLVSSRYATEEQYEQLMEIYNDKFEHCKIRMSDGAWGHSCMIVSFLRPWSRELVDYLIARFGIDSINILSWGSYEYVLAAKNLFKLPIKSENVFSKEDMLLTVKKTKTDRNILIDNEDYLYHKHMVGSPHGSKITFLNGLMRDDYVNVWPFNYDTYDEEYEQTLEEVIKKIEWKVDNEEEGD